MNDEILKSLLKKATGYSYDEVVEEYAVKDGGEVDLIKKKVTRKHLPPDAAALKAYIELESQNNLSKLSDEQLKAEKQRLLKQLKESEKNENRKNRPKG
ncbi:MAG: hypothetical protein GX891_01670 [Clostridiales bacterium]|nr:hypothetical protein [Clostridiales bacterium]